MADSCLNPNISRVKELASAINVSPALAASMMSVWMDRNGGKIPNVEDIIGNRYYNTTQHRFVYEKYDLLTKDGKIKQFSKSEAKRIAKSLDRSTNYDFHARKYIGNQWRVLVFNPFTNAVDEPQIPLFDEASINYTLKSVDILSSDKTKQIFEKGEKNNWSIDKILTELAVPKEQKKLLIDMYNNMTIIQSFGDKKFDLREQLILELQGNYSYTVEINTAKEGGTVGKNQGLAINEARNQGLIYGSQDFNDFVKNYVETKGEKYIEKPTQYYSNLTVPGGTNYTEQEIATPAITPSIKGHAEFATDKGIGWFRSDEQITKSGDNITQEIDDSEYYTLLEKLESTLNIDLLNIEYKQDLENKITEDLYEKNKLDIEKYFSLRDIIIKRNVDNFLDEDNREYQSLSEQYINKQGSKTRRILEVQSDWGQKQRKSSEPDINIKYDIQQIINDLQKLGDLKIDCN